MQFRQHFFSPTALAFGVFSHSKGFGAEWLFASLWFSGADPSWASKRFRGRSRGRFHQGSTKEGQGSTKKAQGSTKVTPRFYSDQTVYGSLGQIRLGLPKGSAEGSTVSPVVPLCGVSCSRNRNKKRRNAGEGTATRTGQQEQRVKHDFTVVACAADPKKTEIARRWKT